MAPEIRRYILTPRRRFSQIEQRPATGTLHRRKSALYLGIPGDRWRRKGQRVSTNPRRFPLAPKGSESIDVDFTVCRVSGKWPELAGYFFRERPYTRYGTRGRNPATNTLRPRTRVPSEDHTDRARRIPVTNAAAFDRVMGKQGSAGALARWNLPLQEEARGRMSTPTPLTPEAQSTSP